MLFVLVRTVIALDVVVAVSKVMLCVVVVFMDVVVDENLQASVVNGISLCSSTSFRRCC